MFGERVTFGRCADEGETDERSAFASRPKCLIIVIKTCYTFQAWLETMAPAIYVQAIARNWY